MELCGLYTTHRCEPDANPIMYPIHVHNSHEILMLTKGCCSIIIGDNEYELEANDVALIIENETHGLVIHSAPVEFFAVQFIPSAGHDSGIVEHINTLSAKSKNAKGGVYILNDSICPVVLACMRRICDERSDTDIKMYFSYIKVILYELANNSSQKYGFEKSKNRKIDNKAELLNAITEYIGHNLNMINNLTFINKVFHYSNSHVNRIFRDYLGVSVWQYITTKKLDLAFNLLSEGHRAQTVASKCGFSDYSVFYKSFVNQFHVKPSDIKRRISEKS